MLKYPRFLLSLVLLFLLAGLAVSYGQSAASLSGKHVLFLIGEHEYGTEESIPRFAKMELEPLGVKTSFAIAKSNDRDSPLCHEFDGLDALDEADVLVISTRRRYPKTDDMKRIREWIESGKPTLMIRTASHAFGERTKGDGYQAPKGHAAWNTIDRDALGASYLGHYRDWEGDRSKRARYWPEASKIDHPILKGFKVGDFVSMGDKLYKYEDLEPEVEVLLSARYPNEEAIHPVAWINSKDGKRVFYSSLGTLEEMASRNTKRLLVNAIRWLASEKPSVAAKSESREKEATGSGRDAVSSHSMLGAADGLTIDLISQEPEMAQPSFIDFDERGRMWVVQYRQYPFPAGLTLENRDVFWRAQYTEKPAPPGDPNYVPGVDLISIHEDTNGDGDFDKVKTFQDGLSMVTSLARDKDGVFVLQPPYLLYYDDKNHDDVPDGKPEVVLSGFGIEDTHSTANSLCWGPDGWLYGAQGSTVTAAIEIAGSDAAPIKSIGQLMWRYHPVKRTYEVFSEGGGNIWSCEFDSKGRLYAGANEGRKLGYHYMQGSYNRKNFSKHGALSNNYAFGYFNGIEELGSQRVTTNLMVYEEGQLPARYDQSILTANALAGQVLASRKVPIGPSLHSKSIDTMLNSGDRWVRPVYLAPGPDGAVYVADWYDQQVNHFRNSEGRISSVDGRVYRIRSEKSEPGVSVDLGRLSSDELVVTLSDERRWYRETARRLLNERQDRSVLPKLAALIRNETGQLALEALWVSNLLGGFSERLRLKTLEHSDPWVRLWTIRLIGDGRVATDRELAGMIALAANDPHIEVRQQIASTASRLPAGDSLRIIESLLKRDQDANDPYIPMMVWWALEKACGSDPELVLEMFSDQDLFDRPMVLEPMLGFTMRRFASDGRRDSLKTCAALLALAPDNASKQALIAGFEEAFRGRSMQGLPDELIAELAKSGGGSLALRIRQGEGAAMEKASKMLKANAASEEERRRVIEALGEVAEPSMLNVLLNQLKGSDEATLMVTLSALQSYNSPKIGETVSDLYPRLSDHIKRAAQTLLSSRRIWANQWVDRMASGSIDTSSIPEYAIAGLRRHNDSALTKKLNRLWPKANQSSGTEELEISRIQSILSKDETEGDRYAGRDLYLGRCAACHNLHSEGGEIGPELTGYQRQDLDSLLLAISSPNAEVREGFENYTVRTVDGQTITGFLADQDDNVIVLRPIGGQKVVLERERIANMESAGGSLMPSGLLADLDDKGIVDFFAYLRSTQPLNVK
ncbi:MAG: putative membrane-bound dehydrogenase-like protein [Candidatus Pelagisphaera sp.]|jgi:putative membrane-bound dehydrogenase-like protein